MAGWWTAGEERSLGVDCGGWGGAELLKDEGHVLLRGMSVEIFYIDLTMLRLLGRTYTLRCCFLTVLHDQIRYLLYDRVFSVFHVLSWPEW